MDSKNRIVAFAILFAVALVLQLALLAADCRQTPLRVADQFARNYYYLDARMQDYLCESLAADGEVVDQYLYRQFQEASQRGLPVKYLRHMFTKLHFKTLHQDDRSAQIQIQGTTRVAINPVFMVVGKLFFIGRNHPVEATLDLVKEDGAWRVCGAPFGLAMTR